MVQDNDFIEFVSDEPTIADMPKSRLWKVAVIDDDPAVHDGTRFALYGYDLHGQGLEILSAYSAAEGETLLSAHPDTAVILLDVVMETDTAGLDLVTHIRNVLGNELVRIILRTGQPGHAPERRVIVDHDINDYRAKTEITANNLFTAITAAIRSYEQLRDLATTRRGLEIIVGSAAAFSEFESQQSFAAAVVRTVAAILETNNLSAIAICHGRHDGDAYRILAGHNYIARFITLSPDSEALNFESVVEGVFKGRVSRTWSTGAVRYVPTQRGDALVLCLDADRPLSGIDQALLETLCTGLAIAFDNLSLYDELGEANRRLEQRVEERTHELNLVNQRIAAQWLQARRVNALQRELLGTLAHDLKNPLGIILGRAEILNELIKSAGVAMEQMPTQIERIRESAQRLSGMVERLIEDAMSDALDISVRRERVALDVLVKEVVEANLPLAEKKSQIIGVFTSAPLGVEGDYDRLREAVDNVLSNAIKFSPVGGRIEIAMELNEGQAQIHIRDSGPGLRGEDHSRLFGRFQRLSARPTFGESSTGLGLSIAKRIVDLHGGRIFAHSAAPHRGATFTISLEAVGLTE